MGGSCVVGGLGSVTVATVLVGVLGGIVGDVGEDRVMGVVSMLGVTVCGGVVGN